MTKEATKNAIKQTYEKKEVIIVDDGSEKMGDLDEYVEDIDNVTYIRHKTNRGQAAAENTGIKNSKGEVVSFMDSDTFWLPEKTELQVDKLIDTNQSIEAVYCGHYNELEGYIKKSKRKYKTGYIFEDVLKGNIKITTSTIMVTKNSLKRIGGWDESLSSYIDYDLCLRLSQQYGVAPVQKPLVISRSHDKERISIDIEAKKNGIKKVIKKWKKSITENYSNGIEKYKKNYISMTYRGRALFEAKKGNRRKSLMLAKKYMYINKSFDIKFLATFMLILVHPKISRSIKSKIYKLKGVHISEVL